MGLLQYLGIAKRSDPLENPANSFIERNIWGDVFSDNRAKIAVSESTILNLSAVWAANRVLSESIATPPLHVYDRDKGGVAKDYYLDSILHDNVSEFLTSFNFREIMQSHLNLWGNAYARIVRDQNGQVKEFEVYHPSKVSIEKKNQLWYRVESRGNAINARDMLHIPAIVLNPDDYVGVSPIIYGKEMFANGIALQGYANTFFGNNTNLGGFLETAEKLTPEYRDRLEQSWNTKYAGVRNSNKTAVLEQGLKYNRIGIEPEAAQFLGSREFSVEEVARWFRVPPHMIADLRRATFSNIEHQSIEFVTHCLLPWVTRWEQELNRKLFSEEQKKRYYVRFNLEGFLRGDAKARSEYYRTMFNIAAMNPNEIREKEEMQPYAGGEKYYIQTNMSDINNLNKNQNNGQEGNQEL